MFYVILVTDKETEQNHGYDIITPGFRSGYWSLDPKSVHIFYFAEVTTSKIIEPSVAFIMEQICIVWGNDHKKFDIYTYQARTQMIATVTAIYGRPPTFRVRTY